MNKKIKEALKNFKPEFGNLNHIRALQILDKIRKKEALEEKKRRVNNEIDEEIMDIEEELSTEERSLEYLLR